MRRLVFSPCALDDALSARRWYEGQREGLGRAFDLALEAAVERIRRLPESGRPIDPPFRRTVLRRFPYEVFYEFDATRVLVVLVFHTARDPASVFARLQRQ